MAHELTLDLRRPLRTWFRNDSVQQHELLAAVEEMLSAIDGVVYDERAYKRRQTGQVNSQYVQQGSQRRTYQNR